MKILILEPDVELVGKIQSSLNCYRSRIDVVYIQDIEDLLQSGDSLFQYSLFILNLENPLDKSVLDKIRVYGTEPVLLILEKNTNLKILKDIYYLGYDDIIIKDFTPIELVFRIYKLCHLWNEDNFYISKNSYFNFKESEFVYNNKPIKLGHKESLLLKFLFMENARVASVDRIIEYVYENDVVTNERVRSLVRQLREKIPIPLIKTIKGEGYAIMM